MTPLKFSALAVQWASSSAAVRKGSGSSWMESSSSAMALSSLPSRTMNPPPTEKKVAWCSTVPAASETANFMPLVWRGSTVSGCRTMSLTA